MNGDISQGGEDRNRQGGMSREHTKRRFGTLAVSKGFISIDQFTEALEVQAREDLAGTDRRLIGEILVDLHYMTASQVNDVLEDLITSVTDFECPECGIIIYKCPNCGAQLR